VDSKIGVVVAHALVLDSKFVVDSAVADGIVGNAALVVVVGGGGEVDAAVAVLVARQNAAAARVAPVVSIVLVIHEKTL